MSQTVKVVLIEEEIRNIIGNYVLYFYANWMPRSMTSQMFRMLEKAQEFDIRVLAIDVDSFKSQTKIFNIERVPSICLFRNGESIKKIEGYMLTATFRAQMREIYKGNKDE